MINRVFNYLYRKGFYLLNNRKYKLLSSTAIIQRLLRVDGRENISIEKNVIIQKMTWIAAVPLTSESKCNLVIGEGSIIGHFNHIYATGEIILGKNVLTADKVYISDNLHQYEDINLPIMNQGIKQLPKLKIGDGTWIGENVCIIGANIGKNCVIGANSVVTKDIPDYCVAVGSPAKIIKRYNITLQKWEKV
ncbi:acyltransferase [Flavobacterium sp. N502540]|uniref:acyltransferase n=1 Tax=Flavobacterium sp. N502540 TaxID=2986838 RepID=UPI0029CAC45A|nr:acyltransferase [Flavobacterium sp. N502540]